MRRTTRTLGFACLLLLVANAGLPGRLPIGRAGETSTSGRPEAIDFNRDIRPILSNTCYQCHGPDENQRQAGLRLDTREGALGAGESGRAVIMPGDPGASLLVARITAADPAERMPPAESEKKLTADEIERLTRWIAQGAPWRGHWAFERPVRPQPPAVSDESRIRNPIDRFIAARLEREGLRPSPEADRETLIRRVTFDLTGLPPTLVEIDAFLADEAPAAYERVVDRLLASPRYGEHMARFWLDAARYGDTHGLHLDNERSMWPYRQWVIDALNANLPFDRFTIEQLAGDLLPEPTREQRVATGFSRCNVTTSEGGSIDEEFYVRYAVDRVETMSTVWLGLTAGCAVCHDHKFDPLTQRDFYSMFAFFNSLTEKAMDGNAPAPPPVIRVPTAEQEAEESRLNEQLAELRGRLDAPHGEIDAAQAAWEPAAGDELAARWQVLEPAEVRSTGGATLRVLDDNSILAEGENPPQDVYEIVCRTDGVGMRAVRLEALLDDGLPQRGPGRSENSNFVLSEIELEAVSLADPAQVMQVKFAQAAADHAQENGGYLVAKAIDGVIDATNGWAVEGYARHENRTAIFVARQPWGFAGGTELRFRLKHQSQFERHAIGRCRLAVSGDAAFVPPSLGTWHSLGPFAAPDGKTAHATDFGPEQGFDLSAAGDDRSPAWSERTDIKDGLKIALGSEVGAVYLARTIESPSARLFSIGVGSDDGIKIWLNDQVVLDRDMERGLKANQDRVELPLAAGANRLLVKVTNYGGSSAFIFKVVPGDLAEELVKLAPLLATEPAARSADQARQLRDYYRRRHWPEWQAWQDEIAVLEERLKTLDGQISRALVMEDMPQRRPAYVLIRGEYDKKGDEVQPGVPAALGALPPGAPPNRLGLAQWLTDPAHPLTARVTVNRYWQQCFGTGIVRTTEDFGSQGQWPTHPELLDWLAVEFVESGWDIKALMRLLVTSATYRQSSHLTPELAERDAENLLLARGPRFRLDGEMVRDQALAVSGLLVEKLGSNSVRPYQPAGLWEAIGYTSSNTARFVQDTGANLYRRSMYTFWKRTSPPPVMQIFDAPSREACTVRRARTNTPLQALALMNDVQFVEAARCLAQRILHEGGDQDAQRMVFAFRLATGRRPAEDELAIVRRVLEAQRARYRSDVEAARQLIAVGDAPADAALDPAELAAWTVIANLILNLDATVTKG